MRHLALAAVLFAFACQTVARQPAEQKPKTDLELLQGTWEIVGLETGGQAEAEKNYEGNTFTFRRDKGADVAVLKEGGFPGFPPVEFTFTLDPSKAPKAIDLTTRGTAVRGIYKLDGDDLTLTV